MHAPLQRFFKSEDETVGVVTKGNNCRESVRSLLDDHDRIEAMLGCESGERGRWGPPCSSVLR